MKKEQKMGAIKYKSLHKYAQIEKNTHQMLMHLHTISTDAD